MKVSLLLALYGGPDQLMPITSGLTAVFAFLLIFWNKVLVVLGTVLNRFRRAPESPIRSSAEAPEEPASDAIERSGPEIS
jgi:hypothetical protein